MRPWHEGPTAHVPWRSVDVNSGEPVYRISNPLEFTTSLKRRDSNQGGRIEGGCACPQNLRPVTRVPQFAKAVRVPSQLPISGVRYSSRVHDCSMLSLATHSVLPSMAAAP